MKLAVALLEFLGVVGLASQFLDRFELLVDGVLELGLLSEGGVDGRLLVVQLLLVFGAELLIERHDFLEAVGCEHKVPLL